MSLSGKFVLRVGPDLHKQLKSEALARKISLNDLILERLGAGAAGPSVVATIRHVFGAELEGVILFGSAARRQMRESSDVDLLIVLRRERPIDRQLYRLWDDEIGPKLAENLSPQFSHRPKVSEPSSLWLEVAIEGKILFECGTTMTDTLREIRHQIAAGRFVRKMSHGHPYWVRTEEMHAK